MHAAYRGAGTGMLPPSSATGHEAAEGLRTQNPVHKDPSGAVAEHQKQRHPPPHSEPDPQESGWSLGRPCGRLGFPL